MEIAIQDANIIIDLVKTNLFGHCMALHYQFTTTNLILEELYDHQVDHLTPHINAGRFTIIECSIEELQQIQLLAQEDRKISVQDWSVIFSAQQKQAILLSGDNRLRNKARDKNIEVHGIFWLLDRLVEFEILSKPNACTSLLHLMEINNRLPSDACQQRLNLWND